MITKKIFVILIFLAFVIQNATVAKASVDTGCDFLTIDPKNDDLCTENLDVFSVYTLNPYNDTRVNFALLLEDADVVHFSIKKDSTDERKYEIPFFIYELTDVNAVNSDTGEKRETALLEQFKQEALSLGLEDSDINFASEHIGESEGRCVSANLATLIKFFHVLKSTLKNKEDITMLAKEHLRIAGWCEEVTLLESQLPVVSDEAKSFAFYLQGAAEFYSGKFEQAEKSFQSLATNSVSWVKETSTYMLTRVYLNQAVANASDEYGFFDKAKVQQDKCKQTEEQINSYLNQYPSGQYAHSAQGLLRRVYWLADDFNAFARQFSIQIAKFKKNKPYFQTVMQIFNDVDYLLSLEKKSYEGVPMMFGIEFLRNMRYESGKTDESDIATYKPIPLSDLTSKKAMFTEAGLESFYDFLILAHYYIESDYKTIIEKTENLTIGDELSNVEFSKFTLRWLALEALKRWTEAEKLLTDLFKHSKRFGQKAQLQLAFAQSYERSGKVGLAFEPNSQVTNSILHRRLIKQSASATLLENILKQENIIEENKATALFTLLYKHLIHNQYAEFIRIMELYPIDKFKNIDGLYKFQFQGQSKPEYVCPSLLDSVRKLVKNPQEPVSLNCIGEFIRLSEGEIRPEYKPPAHHLGGISDGFPSTVSTRLDYYLNVINNPKAKGDAEAYALHRAIWCFASSGLNHCGEQNIPQEQRKKWFLRLKSVYKDSEWAKQQKYYW